jgi:glycogen debranching enzyme
MVPTASVVSSLALPAELLDAAPDRTPPLSGGALPQSAALAEKATLSRQADAGVSENVRDEGEDDRLTRNDRRSLGRTRFREALVSAHRQMRLRNRESAAVRTGNTLFNAWLARSKADLNLLTTDLPTGPYPYAGIPWFSTAFGRDGIITAMQMLWLQPSLAQGVLRFHAAHQARGTSAFRDAAPGKIMHETRKSEMAATGEVPFAMYYGGVDTTPLFVMLAGEYHTRTGDMALINELWSSLELAAQWISNVCDQSPLGLLAYQRGAASGLANQGWKDSQDSVFHADGTFPEGPIALVEVQGYACEAFSTMARLAGLRGEQEAAVRYDRRAATLKERIETHFWMEDQQFYGIAVGGDNRLCRVRASNVGHLLSVGLAPQGRAEAVIAHLRSSEFDNGWGIRTLASGQARFNPMSYHNGSVWPHDTALCAKGIARYGDKRTAIKLLKTLHEAAVGFDMRLPELFCGFTRTRGEPPTAYPVACLPQAWATGAPFMLLEACLGIHIDALRQEILIERPALPEGVDHLEIQSLQIGASTVSLSFSRVNGRVVPSSTPSEVKVVAVL